MGINPEKRVDKIISKIWSKNLEIKAVVYTTTAF